MRETADNSIDRSAPVVRIEVSAGPHAGTVITWKCAGSYLIGRGAHSQLVLAHDLLVSVEHCRLDINEHGCLLHDLESRQGTIVNGTRVSRSWLQSGDAVRIGMSELAIHIGTSRQPAQTVA